MTSEARMSVCARHAPASWGWLSPPLEGRNPAHRKRGGHEPGIPRQVTACRISSEAISKAALTHGQQTADITFDDVRGPKTREFSGFGQVLRRVCAPLTCGRIGKGATGVGIMRRIFDECVHHLMNRRMFGRYMGRMKRLQFRVAGRATKIENRRYRYLGSALGMDDG